MPKVPITLAGWSQDPTERNDAPKIARLTNCQLTEANCIEQMCGESYVEVTCNDGLGLGANIRAMGRSNGSGYAIAERNRPDFEEFGFIAASKCGALWRRHPDNDERFSFIEAPVQRVAFSDEKAHYYFPNILDLGEGNYVVVAERCEENVTLGPTAFTPYVEWALMCGNSGMMFTESGVSTTLGTPLNCHTWMVAAGKYLVLYTAANTVSVLEFNQATSPSSWTVRKTIAVTQATTAGPGKSLDASLSSDGTRLVVAMGNAEVCIVNASTWATVYLGTPAWTITNTAGTVAVAAAGTAGTYTILHLQAASNNWWGESFNDAGAILSGGIVYTSGTPLTSTYLTYRPGMTRTATGTFAANITYNSTSGTSALFATVHFDTTPTVIGQIQLSPSTVPATKPGRASSTSVNTVISWALESSGADGRSLRSALLLGERDYAFGAYRYSAQLTQAFRAGDPAPAPKTDHLYTVPMPMVESAYLPPLINSKRRTGWIAALAMFKEGSADGFGVGTVGTNVWVVMCADARADTAAQNIADLFCAAEARGRTIVASGEPRAMLPHPEMSGFSSPPVNPTLTHPGAGGTPTSGTYLYCLVYRNINANGSVQWSPVSDPVSITTGTNGSNLVSYTSTQTSPQLGVGNASIEVYRTTNGGTVFYRVSEPTSSSSSFTDTVSDATLVTRPVLYTQGDRSGVSGLLDHFGTPPCRCICSGPDRMLAGGLANEYRVQFSNLFYPGEATSWPQNAAFFVDVDAPVTGVWCLDGTWIVFSERSAWAITGQGPDAQGNGTFDEPRKIASVGATSWRSLVEIQQGLCFQAQNSQIYLLQRGGLALQWLSQPIREEITDGTTSAQESPGYRANRVMGAVYDQETQLAVFAMQNGGVKWSYSETNGQWSKAITTTPSGRCIGAWQFEDNIFGYAGPSFTYQENPPEVQRRIGDIYHGCDADFAAKVCLIETDDIDLDGGRVRRGWMTIANEKNISTPASRAFPTVGLYWYFDGKGRTSGVDSGAAVIPETTHLTDFDMDRNWDVEFAPARQKCNQVRLLIAITPEPVQRFRVLGLSLDMESKAKKIRWALGSNRG